MIRVLIVGAGGMAHDHAKAFAAMEGVSIVAVVDKDAEKLAKFQAEFGISRGFASVEAALAWGEFDAASNVTPDAVHHRTTMPLLAAGKHVLCEKPLATNYAAALAMAAAANDAGVVNMVNLTYRNVPALIKAADMVAVGDIGIVRHFEASYLQSWLTQPAWGDWATESQWLWRLSTEHGSMGVLGDVGVHILDFATFVAGSPAAQVSCRLTTFDKAPGGRVGDYLLDANDSFNMHLALANGAVGVVHATRMASGHFNDLRLRIYGTKGGIEVRYENNVSLLRVSIGEHMHLPRWVEVETPEVETNYQRFIGAIRDGRQVEPSFARGADLQKVLDLAVGSDADASRDLKV